MPELVQDFVVFSLLLAILSRRNYRLHSGCFSFLHNGIRVISPIGKQKLSINSLNQLFSLRTIRNGTFCNKYSDRHTMRIHGQMYLGVEPPLVTAIS